MTTVAGPVSVGDVAVDIVTAGVCNGGGKPRKAQLQQRRRKYGVREQVDCVRPGEAGQGTLITGLLSRPVDQQHAELLQDQPDDSGSGDRDDD
jgi:hypothetical protein